VSGGDTARTPGHLRHDDGKLSLVGVHLVECLGEAAGERCEQVHVALLTSGSWSSISARRAPALPVTELSTHLSTGSAVAGSTATKAIPSGADPRILGLKPGSSRASL
jgi:hypothetical protein